jgi:hypothetical protein
MRESFRPRSSPLASPRSTQSFAERREHGINL